jgi:hypothetical protein
LTGGTLTGALNGTTASFTGDITTSAGVFKFGNNYGIQAKNFQDTAYRTVFKLNTSNQIEIGRSTDISDIILGTASATNALTIATTGTATFSSSSGIGVTVLGTAAAQNLSATTGYARFYQGGGFANINIGALTSGSFAGWLQVSDGVGTSIPLAIQPSGGNVLINTTADAGFKLDVNGTGRFSGSLTLTSGGTERYIQLLGYNNSFTSITSNVGFNSSYNNTAILNNVNSTASGQGNTSLPSWVINLGGNETEADTFAIKRSPAGSFTFSNRFILSSTGAATFSGNVNALQGVNVGANALGTDRMFQVSGTSFASGSNQFAAVINPTMGTLTTLYGLYLGINCTSATTGYGIYLEGSGGSITNRWGIYQSSGSDRNYFAGNVLIGTTTDSGYKLKVDGGILFDKSDGTYLALAYGSSVKGYLGIANQVVTSGSTNDIGLSSSNNLVFGTGGSLTERMRITSGGDVLVGTANNSPSAGHGLKNYADGRIYCVSSATSNATESYGMYSTGASNYRFYVGWGGTIFATNTTISSLSDARVKENIRDLDSGLDKIMALKPRVFDWKEGKGKDIKNDRGFIAQEFEEVFPDLIDIYKQELEEGEEPYKSVRADLIPTLVKAIQEQQQQIQEQQEQINKLKNA